MGGALVGLDIPAARDRIDPLADPDPSTVLALFKAIETGALAGIADPLEKPIDDKD